MGEYTSLTAYSDNTLVILTLSSLIIIGGLGFYVWNDIFNYKDTKRLSLQTKLVLAMSIGLVLFGFIMFLIFEIS